MISALPAPSSVECPATPAFATPTATDTCDAAPTLTFVDVTIPGTCPQEFTVTRTWTATDSCGNSSSASQTISVTDNTAPVISALPASSSVECPATPAFATPTATDACDAAPTLTFLDVTTPGTCPQEFTVTRTWTATDACGNSSSASQTISVTDNTGPVVTAGTIGACYPDNASAEAAAILATAAVDACGGTVTKTAATVGTCTAIVTVTATDPCGNTTSVSYNTRIDNLAPVISSTAATQGANNVMNNDCAVNPVVQGTVTITVAASDNCSLVNGHPSVVLVNGTNVADISASAVETPPASGTFIYTWTVTAATASGTWTATITAGDLCQTTTSSFTLCVNPCQITGVVQLESFVGSGTIPLANRRVVTFKATDGLGVVLKTWTLDLTFTVGTFASGGVASYTLTDVPAGTTHLSAKTDWNKRRRLTVPLDPSCQGVANFTGAAAQLRGGDITGDNVVNLADYSLLLSHWLELVSGVPAAAVADMNGDDLVNIDDYTILGLNWFTTGDAQ